VRGVLDALPADRTVVVDLEASPEHFSRAHTAYVDTILLVAEPYFKSLETARRYHELATDLGIDRVAVLANRVRESERDVVEEFCERNGYELAGAIPQDDGFQTAERLGVAPIDHDPDSPGVRAIADLARSL
jgi:CO dehydrogenase maturation factor